MMNEKIIESLKCCSRRNCNDCPMRKCMDGSCVNDLSRDALSLINSQQEEIESIKTKREFVFKFSEEQLDDMVKRVLKSVEFDIDEIKRKAYEQLISKIKTTSSKDLLKIITDLTNE